MRCRLANSVAGSVDKCAKCGGTRFGSYHSNNEICLDCGHVQPAPMAVKISERATLERPLPANLDRKGTPGTQDLN